jgi:hypothetical protein
MIEKIVIFNLFVYLVLLVLRLMKPNAITSFAFAWFGPFPKEGEPLSSFKARRIRYAFSWVIQLSVYFSLLILFKVYFNQYFVETFFAVAGFAGAIGMGMAVFAFFGFVISWVKTITIGPNPKFEYIKEHEEQT